MAIFVPKVSCSLYLPSVIFVGRFLHVLINHIMTFEYHTLLTSYTILQDMFNKNHRHLGLFPDAFCVKYKYIYGIKGHQI